MKLRCLKYEVLATPPQKAPTHITTHSPTPPRTHAPERLEALPRDEAEARLGEVGGLPRLPQELGVLVEVVLEQLRDQDEVLLFWGFGGFGW